MNRPEHSLPDRYTNLKLIGSGGMGSVFRARDKYLEIDVAIKFLSDDINDSEYVKRFQTEAKVAGNLKHHNLVTVFDFGVTEDSVPYLVMEFVEGETLKEYITREGKLPVDIALGILQQIAEAMIYAHQNGVIHRDLKSANIVLSKNEKDEVFSKVIDFGIAYRQDKDASEGKLTKPGSILGSPLYMSPEQIENREIDERTDIYSLGCILFECLTGNVPFKGETAIDTINMHISEPVPEIDECLDNAVIVRCIDKTLAKLPDERYNSMQEFFDDLTKARKAVRAQVESSASGQTIDKLILEERKSILEKSARNLNMIPIFLALLLLGIGALATFMVLMPGNSNNIETRLKPFENKKFLLTRKSDKSVYQLIDLANRAEHQRKFFQMANYLQTAYNLNPTHSLMKKQIERHLSTVEKRYSEKITREKLAELTKLADQDSNFLGDRGLLHLCVRDYQNAYLDLKNYLTFLENERRLIQVEDYVFYCYLAGKLSGNEVEASRILAKARKYSSTSKKIIFDFLLGEISDEDYFVTVINHLNVLTKQKRVNKNEAFNVCQKLCVGGYYLISENREKEAIDVLLFPAFAAQMSMDEKFLSIYALNYLWLKHNKTNNEL